MALIKFYDPAGGKMSVAGFMSGSGTNLKKIIEYSKKLKKLKGDCPYEVTVIFTDNPLSKATAIGSQYDIPVVIRDISAFYKKRGKPRKDLKVREEFDRETLKALGGFNIDLAVFAGYMSIATPPLISKITSINVHPADLSIKDEHGQRKYRGERAVADAIRNGEKFINSTTHIVEPEVDEGRILMISDKLKVEIPDGLNIDKDLKKIATHNQERLKEKGDWKIFPITVRLVAEGRFAYDSSTGTIHFDGKPVPAGISYSNVKELDILT